MHYSTSDNTRKITPVRSVYLLFRHFFLFFCRYFSENMQVFRKFVKYIGVTEYEISLKKYGFYTS